MPQASVEWKVAGATFGHCCSKKQAIFGYKLHLLLTQSGVIRDFELAPANLPDLTVGVELLAGHTDLQVLGDKGYISQPVAADLRAQRNIALVTVPRSNQRASPPRSFATCMRICANSSRPSTASWRSSSTSKPTMPTAFGASTARLYTKLTAHTLCVWLNRLLGVADVLHLKALAFPHN